MRHFLSIMSSVFYSHSIRFAVVALGIVSAGTLSAASALAYSDEIVGVTHEEIWSAANDILSPLGIRKSDPEKGYLESKWVEDITERKDPLFKRIENRHGRRTRYSVQISATDIGTKIEVYGKFQYRREIGASGRGPWRVMKKKSDDSLAERELFNRILQQMAKNRTDTKPV